MDPRKKGCTQRPFSGHFRALEIGATAAAAAEGHQKIGVRKGGFSGVLGVFGAPPKVVTEIRGVAMSLFGLTSDTSPRVASFCVPKSTPTPSVARFGAIWVNLQAAPEAIFAETVPKAEYARFWAISAKWLVLVVANAVKSILRANVVSFRMIFG